MTSTTTKVLYAVVSRTTFSENFHEALEEAFDKVANSTTGCMAQDVVGLWCCDSRRIKEKERLWKEGTVCDMCAYRDRNWRVDNFDSLEVRLIVWPDGG